MLNTTYCHEICPDAMIMRKMYSCTGVIISPTGLEYFIATLAFTKVEANTALSKTAAAAAVSDESVYSCMGMLGHSIEYEDSIKAQSLPKLDDNMSAAVSAAAAASLSDESELFVKLASLKVVRYSCP